LANPASDQKRSSVALTESTCDEDTPLCTQRFFPNNGSDSPNKELVPLTEVCTPESAQTASSDLSSPNSPVADHPFYKGLPSLVSQADMENQTYEKIEHEKHNHYPELGNKTIQKTLEAPKLTFGDSKEIAFKSKEVVFRCSKEIDLPPQQPTLSTASKEPEIEVSHHPDVPSVNPTPPEFSIRSPPTQPYRLNSPYGDQYSYMPNYYHQYPPTGYGVPPQGSVPQGYGAPPQGSVPQGYGAPPQGSVPSQGYGVPPQGSVPQGYGVPPQGSGPSQGYGAPPPGYGVHPQGLGPSPYYVTNLYSYPHYHPGMTYLPPHQPYSKIYNPATLCGRCSTPIVEGSTSISFHNRSYHSKCYACNNCKLSLIENGAHEHTDGGIYCMDCYFAINLDLSPIRK